MEFVIGLGLILVAALVVAAPLFQPEPTAAAPGTGEDATERWEKQKRAAYAAIKEADLDLEMGKLSPADYETMRAAQEARALEALRALESMANARGRRSGDAHRCPSCGAPAAPGSYCTGCGASVPG
jgi:hypothetical protein